MEGSSGKKDLDDKILVTIYENKFPLSILRQGSKSFYVPATANVYYLRTFISDRYANSKDSSFLFAYGNILNNNESIESIQNKYRSRLSPKKGLEIEIASMASF